MSLSHCSGSVFILSGHYPRVVDNVDSITLPLVNLSILSTISDFIHSLVPEFDISTRDHQDRILEEFVGSSLCILRLERLYMCQVFLYLVHGGYVRSLASFITASAWKFHSIVVFLGGTSFSIASI